jgi:glycosyltransferase involved in cell wall biosynthesis
MAPTIYFLTPDVISPCGGIKQAYRHVNILCSAGINAKILHFRSGFKLNWMDIHPPTAFLTSPLFTLPAWTGKRSSNPIPARICPKTIFRLDNGSHQQFRSEDIIVIPELLVEHLSDKIHGIRSVIYNQGSYLSFGYRRAEIIPLPKLYQSDQLLGIIAVSTHCQNYLRHLLPKQENKIYRIFNGIDSTLFSWSPNKEKIITYMPKRNGADLCQVINTLRSRGMARDWQFMPLENLTEEEVANAFKRSAIFLSGSQQDGFGLPPVEAGACGCTVVGYHGNGGKEFLSEETGYPVEQGDVYHFAQRLEHVINLFDSGQTDEPIQKQQQFQKLIKEKYSLENEQKSILNAWKRLLKSTS